MYSDEKKYLTTLYESDFSVFEYAIVTAIFLPFFGRGTSIFSFKVLVTCMSFYYPPEENSMDFCCL